MKSWRCLWLGMLFYPFFGSAEHLGEYQVEPFLSQEQGFTGGSSNQFPRMAGVYNGLIMPAGAFVPEQSGYFRIQISDFRSYSGRMNVADDTVRLRGHFTRSGRAGLYVYRRIWDDCLCFYSLRLVWIVNFELVAGTDEIQGSVEHVRQGWISDLAGFRGYGRRDGIAPERGRYTLRFPGSVDPVVAPSGDGYGAVNVQSRGELTVNGQLADGTAFSRTAVISTNGWWPFYLPLSSGGGAVIGWLNFSTQTSSDIAGDLRWVRPPRSDRQFYPDGFSGTIAATGSRYSAPSSTETALSWTDGTLSLSGGNLTSTLSNSIMLRAGGGLIDLGGDIAGLTFSLNRGTGVMKGRFIHPISGRKTSYAGVMDQLQDVGSGFFLGTDQSGLLLLEPAP